jgi:tetratricopeptide (TPR) repeat protein
MRKQLIIPVITVLAAVALSLVGKANMRFLAPAAAEAAPPSVESARPGGTANPSMLGLAPTPTRNASHRLEVRLPGQPLDSKEFPLRDQGALSEAYEPELQSMRLLEKGEITAAEQTVRQVLESTPERASLHNLLGRILLLDHRPAEAEQAFLEALLLQPNNLELLRNLAGSLEAQGLIAEVIPRLRTALRRTPGRAELHLLLGRYLVMSGEFDAALTELETAIAMDEGWLRRADLNQPAFEALQSRSEFQALLEQLP